MGSFACLNCYVRVAGTSHCKLSETVVFLSLRHHISHYRHTRNTPIESAVTRGVYWTIPVWYILKGIFSDFWHISGKLHCWIMCTSFISKKWHNKRDFFDIASVMLHHIYLSLFPFSFLNYNSIYSIVLSLLSRKSSHILKQVQFIHHLM